MDELNSRIELTLDDLRAISTAVNPHSDAGYARPSFDADLLTRQLADAGYEAAVTIVNGRPAIEIISRIA